MGVRQLPGNARHRWYSPARRSDQVAPCFHEDWGVPQCRRRSCPWVRKRRTGRWSSIGIEVRGPLSSTRRLHDWVVASVGVGSSGTEPNTTRITTLSRVIVGVFVTACLSLLGCGEATESASGSEPTAQVEDELSTFEEIPLEVAIVTNVGSGNWATFTLRRTYRSMVVIATPVYTETSVPLVTRIRNATENHFDLRVARFDGRTGAVAPIAVSY